jgi:hypothetical protein
MKRSRFEHLLSLACVTHARLSEEERKRPVRVQWDPERSVAVGKLEYRSIQIGIRPELSEVWAKEWVEGIEVSAPTPEERRLIGIGCYGAGEKGEGIG